MNLNVKIQLQFLSKMNMLELQRLTRENDKKNGKLISQSTSIDCLKSDLQTQAQIINRQKSELEEAKKEIKSLKRKLQQEEMERERVQGRYLLVLQNLENELEQNKKKYSKLQNKIIPLIDNDTVRLKILNQVQSNHQMQINNLKNSIESLKDEILRLKRENQVLKHVIQNQKLSHEEQIRRLKSNKNQQFAQDTINYLNYAMWREIQTKLKNSYEQARKQADFYKDKYFAVQKKYQAKISMLDREQYESKQDFRKR